MIILSVEATEVLFNSANSWKSLARLCSFHTLLENSLLWSRLKNNVPSCTIQTLVKAK